jgi:hypothetical protein
MKKHANSIPCEFDVRGQMTQVASPSTYWWKARTTQRKSEQGTEGNRIGKNGMGDCLETQCDEGFRFMQYP